MKTLITLLLSFFINISTYEAVWAHSGAMPSVCLFPSHYYLWLFIYVRINNFETHAKRVWTNWAISREQWFRITTEKFTLMFEIIKIVGSKMMHFFLRFWFICIHLCVWWHLWSTFYFYKIYMYRIWKGKSIESSENDCWSGKERKELLLRIGKNLNHCFSYIH